MAKRRTRKNKNSSYKSKAAQRSSGKFAPAEPAAPKKLTQGEKRRNALIYFEREKRCGATNAEAAAKAAEETGYKARTILDLVKASRKQGVDAACHDRKPGSGPPSIITPTKQKHLEEYSKEKKGNSHCKKKKNVCFQ